MRKSLVLTLLLFALSILGIGYAHGAVNGASDNVELTENTILGDISAAQGLSVNIRNHYQNHLSWNTTLQLGNSPTTEFSFSPSKIYEEREENFSGVQMYINNGMSASTNGKLELTDANTGGISKIYKDVASRTENGTAHKEKVLIKDYYDFYPVVVDLFLPNNHLFWMEAIRKQDYERNNTESYSSEDNSYFILKGLTDYFKFPVQEKHQLEVTIVKDDMGNVVELSSSTVDGSDVWLNAVNAITDDSCYFTVSAMTRDGDFLDYSYVPAGYGIYRLPYDSEEPQKNLEAMTMVYPLSTTEQVIYFQPTADKSKLLLLTREENFYYLKVLDAKTVQELQKIPLMGSKEDYWVNEPYVGEDFLVALFNDKEFVVLQEASDDNYAVQFSGILPDTEVFAFNRAYNSVMAFDGERLAVVSINEDHSDVTSYPTSCGFSLVVSDKTGVLYAGTYASSLDKGQPQEYNDRIRAMDYKPLRIWWEGKK